MSKAEIKIPESTKEKIRTAEKKIEFTARFMKYLDEALETDNLFILPFDIDELNSKNIIYRTEDDRIFHEFAKWLNYIFSKEQSVSEFYMGLTEYEDRLPEEQFLEKAVVPSIVVQYGLFSFMWFVSYLEEEDCFVLSEKFIDAVKYDAKDSGNASGFSGARFLQTFASGLVDVIEKYLEDPDSFPGGYKKLITIACENFNLYKNCKGSSSMENTLYMYSTNEHLYRERRSKTIRNAVDKIRSRNIGCQEEFFIVTDKDGKLNKIAETKHSINFMTGKFALKKFSEDNINVSRLSRKDFFDFLTKLEKLFTLDLKLVCNDAAKYTAAQIISMMDEYDSLLTKEKSALIEKIKSMDEKEFFPATMEDPDSADIDLEKYYGYDQMEADDVRVLDEILGIERYMKVVRKFNGTYRPYKAINPEYYKSVSVEDAVKKYTELSEQNDLESMCALAYFSRNKLFLQKAVSEKFIPAVALAGELSRDDDECRNYLKTAIKKRYPLAALSFARKKLYESHQEADGFLDQAAEILIEYECEEYAGECRYNQFLLNKFFSRNSKYVFEALHLGYKANNLSDEWPRYKCIVEETMLNWNLAKEEDIEEIRLFRKAYEMYFERHRHEYIHSKIRKEFSQPKDINSIAAKLDDINYARNLERTDPQLYVKALQVLDGKGDWYSSGEYGSILLTGKYGCKKDIRKCIEVLKKFPHSTLPVQMLISIYLSVLDQRHYSGMIRFKGSCHIVSNREYYDNDFSVIPTEEAINFFRDNAAERPTLGWIMTLLYTDKICTPQNEEEKENAFRWIPKDELKNLKKNSSRLREQNLKEQKEYAEKRDRVKNLADIKNNGNAMLEYALNFLNYERLKTPEAFEYIKRAAENGNMRAKSIMDEKNYDRLSIREKIKNAKKLVEDFKRNAFNGYLDSLDILIHLYSSGPDEIFDRRKALCYEMLLQKSSR